MFRRTRPHHDDVPAAPRRRRISSAHVLSGAALFVALGGTSYAAATLPVNSVGTKQVRNESLTSVDLKDGSLKRQDFKAGEIAEAPTVGLSSLPDAATVTGTTPTTVGGLSQQIKVPAGAPRRIVANLTGESQCTTAGYCSLRILVDGHELTPNVGNDFAFNTTGGATWTSLAVQRFSGTLSPGSHQVTVQHYGTAPTTVHRLDDATLAVEQVLAN